MGNAQPCEMGLARSTTHTSMFVALLMAAALCSGRLPLMGRQLLDGVAADLARLPSHVRPVRNDGPAAPTPPSSWSAVAFVNSTRGASNVPVHVREAYLPFAQSIKTGSRFGVTVLFMDRSADFFIEYAATSQTMTINGQCRVTANATHGLDWFAWLP